MNVTIRYITENATAPSDKIIDIATPLTSEHLPTLSSNGYSFLGWVHVNKDGHESSLSERMMLSTDWLLSNDTNNEYYVIFTAKWNRNSKTNSDGSISNAVLYVPQTLSVAQKAQARQNIGMTNIGQGSAEIKDDMLYLEIDTLGVEIKDDILYIA